MIRLAKFAALLQTALIVVAVFMLCGSGRAQSTPSLSINPPINGTTTSSAYIGIGFNLTGISNVTSGTVTLTDNAGHTWSYPIAGSGRVNGVSFGTSALIPSGATSA